MPISDYNLLQPTDVSYVGSFRVPIGTFGTALPNLGTLNNGLARMVFNAANGSLIVTGSPNDPWSIAEITIPGTLSTSLVQNDLPLCSFIHEPKVIKNLIPNYPAGMQPIGALDTLLNGLVIYGGDLYFSWAPYYDTTDAAHTHSRMTGTDISTGTLSEIYSSSLPAGFWTGHAVTNGHVSKNVAGYMCEIPSGWQSDLGGKKVITGSSNMSVISKTSAAPAAFGWDPADLGVTDPMPLAPYQWYPWDLPNRFWDVKYLTTNDFTSIVQTDTGVMAIPGSRTVLYHVAKGVVGGFCWYGNETLGIENPYASDPIYSSLHGTIQADDKRPVAGNGYHCTNLGGTSGVGMYARELQFWDALEFKRVYAGSQERWAASPYARLTLSTPIADAKKYTGGMAYDATTHRLYLAGHQDYFNSGGGSYYPLVHVYDLANPGLPSVPPTNPGWPSMVGF